MLIAGDSAIAWLRGWRAPGRIDSLVLAGSALWIAAIVIVALAPRGRAILSRYAGQFTLLVSTVCVAWLGSEWAVGKMLARVGDPFHAWRPNSTLVQRPLPGVMRGVGPEAVAQFNSWGIRGGEPPARDEAYRILCLGGSTTACTYLDDAKTWPQQLADRLNAANPQRKIWVGNAGMPGFRAPEHARFMTTSQHAGEIDCLVVQAGFNDFMSCLAGPRPEPLWLRSNIRHLTRTLMYRSGDSAVEDTAGDVYRRRREMRAAAAIDDRPPEIEPCLEQFGADLDRIVAECRRRKIRLILTTQPVLWRDDLDEANRALLWFGALPDGRFLSVEQLRAGIDRYNEAVRRAAGKNGVELVDLADLNGREDAFYDDCHFTEHGAALVAEALAAHFTAHESRPAEAAR